VGDAEDQHASAKNRDQPKRQQSSVELFEKGRGLVERLQNFQADCWRHARCNFYRTRQKPLRAQFDLSARVTSRTGVPEGFQQCLLVLFRYCAARYVISIPEDNFAAGCTAEFAQKLIVNFIAHGERAGNPIVGSWTKLDRLHEHLVEMPATKPPVIVCLLLKCLSKKFLRGLLSETGA
jgi:hypothetical protein